MKVAEQNFDHPCIAPAKTHQDGSLITLEIIDGPCLGVIFRYGKIAFIPDETDKEVPFKLYWEREILYIPPDVEYNYKKEDIEKILFTYLLDILDQQIKEKQIIYNGGQ